MIINCVLSIKDFTLLVVHVTLVKPNVIQRLDAMNIIITTMSSEPLKHLQSKINYCFTWNVI